MSEAQVAAIIQLPPNNLNALDQISNRWDVEVPHGVKPEALLDPAFWAHRAPKMKPWDEIRARAQDGTWMGRYLVLDSSRVWVRVKLLEFHQLTSSDVSLTQASMGQLKDFKDQHNVVFRGMHKWSVVRKSDKAVLHQGEEQKEGAAAWLDAYARQTIGAALVPAPEKQPVPA